MYRTVHKKKALPQDNIALFIAVSFFIGIFGIIFFGSRTLVSTMFLTRLFAGTAVILSLIPRKFFPTQVRIRKYLKPLLVVAGLSPVVTSLILATNFLINTEQTDETLYVKSMQLFDSGTLMEVKLEYGKFAEYKQIRRFDVPRTPVMPDAIDYKIGEGIFGMTVIRNKEMIYDKDFSN